LAFSLQLLQQHLIDAEDLRNVSKQCLDLISTKNFAKAFHRLQGLQELLEKPFVRPEDSTGNQTNKHT
jgi:hypothetical protein